MASSSGIMIAVSPARRSPTTPGSTKRKITPSAKLSSSKRTLILTTPSKRPATVSQGAEIPTQPYFAPKQLFPHGLANVAHSYTHGHPPSKGPGEETETAHWNSRNVFLPFQLQDRTVNIYEGEVKSLLYDVFPGTTNVTQGRFRSHIMFQVKDLPKGPWPLTVGGVPLTICDSHSRGRALLFPRQNFGNFSISICTNYQLDNFSDAHIRKLAAAVAAEFAKNSPKTKILEMMLTKERTIYVVVEDHININQARAKLPGKIANCPVGYINDQELHRPLWANRQAKRQIQPRQSSGIVDNTAYETLRPGVMICSKRLADHAHPAVSSTTSGVLVKNSVGTRFMTAASHGIGENATVWQANHWHKTIGNAIMEIPFTDVSLISLSEGVRFENETFENESGEVPKFTRLTTSNEDLDWSFCYLDSPYTGSIEGTTVMKSVKFESSADPREERIRYIVYQWAFMGQEEGNDHQIRPPDGTCGSAIWNSEGIVVGFYHYYIEEGQWAGFSASVSASEVGEAGHTLAD